MLKERKHKILREINVTYIKDFSHERNQSHEFHVATIFEIIYNNDDISRKSL